MALVYEMLNFIVELLQLANYLTKVFVSQPKCIRHSRQINCRNWFLVGVVRRTTCSVLQKKNKWKCQSFCVHWKQVGVPLGIFYQLFYYRNVEKKARFSPESIHLFHAIFVCTVQMWENRLIEHELCSKKKELHFLFHLLIKFKYTQATCNLYAVWLTNRFDSIRSKFVERKNSWFCLLKWFYLFQYDCTSLKMLISWACCDTLPQIEQKKSKYRKQ